MRSIFLLIFGIGLLFGTSCARNEVQEADRAAIRLQFAEPNDEQKVSKVVAFAGGDEVGVFARVEGREIYEMTNSLFKSDQVGVLSGDPAVYFPDARQAMDIFAYFPFDKNWNGSWSTPIDQTDLRKADLLWGKTVSTPTQNAVPIVFSHLLSKIEVIVTGKTVAQVTAYDMNIVGTLDVETGTFMISNTADRYNVVGGSELIVPAQGITRLAVKVNSKEYTFALAQPLALQKGKKHKLTLSLSDADHTASLETISVVSWTIGNSEANLQESVNNQFTVCWALPAAGYDRVTSAKLHIGAQEIDVTSFTIAQGGNSQLCSYTFDFVQSDMYYPYTITGVSFYNGTTLVETCTSLLGVAIYKSGAYTIGIEAGNILSVESGTVNPFDPESGTGSISGGVENSFLLQLIEYPTYSNVKKVRITIDKVPYMFEGINFESNSNALIAITKSFTFSGNRPSGYPCTIEKVELLGASSNLLKSFEAEVMISRGGLVSLQLAKGQADALVTGFSVTGYAPEGNTGVLVPIEVTNSSISINCADPAAGKAANLIKKAVLTIKTSTGGTAVVTISGYTMSGNALAAWSSNTVAVTSGTGWPAQTKFPYWITHVKLLDVGGQEVVANTAFATPLEVRGAGTVVISVMKKQ